MVRVASQSRTVLPFDAEALATHRGLVARMAARDAEALQLLYLDFGARIHGVVRRILEDPEDAREAVQDAFIKAWQQAGSYRPERGEVVSWLVFIARNAAIDRIRKGARRRLLQEALEREPVETVMPAHELSDLQENLSRHLNELSPAQRQALELAFFSGCTQAQIATAMRTPVGNVKNHLRRGLARLRQIATQHDQGFF
ncbi:RNA polymerase, sigma-24 subunit, ECF subfamily [Opitutus terrae PB90-1]|uniref:RNA polymerase, sigma-24 subunit, ECF subfamily n=1 Tax=Opitutus terrae (strain DSM 11246 / JCM 15787 / PB90-1) TaxID=452637 RepID=B1ZSY5_OPITP|nr:RNA polymerase, sigma-24 subunit, ECF subfamily [Opitutus terrae PB90-1]